MQKKQTLAAAGLMALALAAHAEGQWSVSAGYDYTSGDYGGDTTTTIQTIPVTINYLDGAWRTTVTVPWISVTGNGSVIPGPGGPMSFSSGGSSFGMGWRTPASTTVTNTGLGDVTVAIGRAVFSQSKGFYEVSARVKLGTADPDKYLGTGENDYALQFDGMLGDDKVLPFFTIGYYVTGDPAGYTYNDVPYGSVGLMFRNAPGTSMGVGYDYRSTTIDGTDDLQQISAFYGWQTQSGWNGNVSGLVGLSNSAPDVGFNVTLGRVF